MAIKSFIDADPNNPPKCTTCNDYGGVYDDEKIDPQTGEPWSMSCPDCPEYVESIDNYCDRLDCNVIGIPK